MLIGGLLSGSSVFAQGATSPADGSSSTGQAIENRPARYLWRKPEKVVLRQLGSMDKDAYIGQTFEVPTFSELRSGQFALGKELIQRQGRLFVVANSPALKSASMQQTGSIQTEPVTTYFNSRQSPTTPKILEAQKNYNAAEAFHKIFLKTVEKEKAKAGVIRQQVASDYRDFLIRQRRFGDARQIEQQFDLEPEDISEGSEALEPLSKRVKLSVPGAF